MEQTLNFSSVESPHLVNSEWVLNKVDQNQIFYAYFGDFIPYKKSYNSVFRKDRSASTGFFFGDSGELVYYDLGTGENLNCFAFVAKMYGIKYGEAIRKVACDFGLIQCEGLHFEKKEINNSINFEKKNKEEREIQIIPAVWNLKHAKYWRQYGITKEELEKEHVYAVDKLFIDKNLIVNKNDVLRFAYVVSVKGKGYMKIYSPYADKFKWISNINLNTPFGWDTLNLDSETVYVTKSLKDMIVLKKIFPSVISTQNESEGALNSGLVKFLCKNFKKRIIVFDNDAVGVENCKKFNEKGFGYFNIPKDYIYEGIKDPSDFVAAYGIEKLKNLFKQKNLL